jgi:quinol monooxygenase YgiN
MMMRSVMVRYRVRAERAAENEALVRAVYAQLHDEQPDGFHYATFVQDDGVSFVHVAFSETEAAGRLLPQLSAFQRFQEGIRERCEEPPVVSELREVGSFRFHPDERAAA